MPATCSPKVSGFKYLYLGMGRATKTDEFSEKFQRGGVIFNPQIYVANLYQFHGQIALFKGPNFAT